MNIQTLKTITLNLLSYCQSENFSGHDPYDALNSRLFQMFPFLDHRIPRLVLIQAMKRSPVNFRRLIRVPKTQNPKALALFLTAFLKLRHLRLLPQDDLIPLMIERLSQLRSPLDPSSPASPYCSWGYSFPWQTRSLLVPSGAPNLVCTTFVANALLDAYEAGEGAMCLEMAKNAAAYIANELYWAQTNGVASFSYPTPSSRSRVHNANFLGAALLIRMHRHTGQEALLEPALKVCRYSASRQAADGAWFYGEHSTQHWIDNFHTGYNLCALADIGTHLGTDEFKPHIQRGFDFYLKHFFEPDGAPKYFHNRTFPIDIHSAAQSIITLVRFKALSESSLPLAMSVLDWSLGHLLSGQGYFYYQKTTHYTNRISYMRWSQAWMLLALATLLEDGLTH